MHIAINVDSLENGHARRGTGRYAGSLIEALRKYEPEHSYTLFTRGQKLPVSVDLVHYPHFDPFFLTLPLVKQKPTVVTVHDLIPLKFPEHFPPGIRGSLKWQIQKRSLQGSRRIITDSACSQSDIVDIVGFDRHAIDVVYLAPKDIFSSGKKEKSVKPYILYVGDVNWNKNIPELKSAFARVQAKMPALQLVLVGQAFGNRVTDDELVALYRGAELLVLPSLYEGFGFPVLEAMACGCPVVAADTSSLTEIAGPAIKVEPAAGSIATGMQKCLSLTDRERKNLVLEGTAWAKKFTWEKVARETVASYARALA